MSTITPFHLVFPVHDLESTRRFYVDVLGCGMGRRDLHWIDFDLFGHQVVAHLVADANADAGINPVDGEDVPVPHFGVVLEMEDWTALVERLNAHDIKFVIEPTIRFEGTPGEQATCFFRDPSGNALEFKAFRDMGMLFTPFED